MRCSIGTQNHKNTAMLACLTVMGVSYGDGRVLWCGACLTVMGVSYGDGRVLR